MSNFIQKLREAPYHISRARHFVRTLKHLSRSSTEYMHNSGVGVIKHEWWEAIEEIEKHLESLHWSICVAVFGDDDVADEWREVDQSKQEFVDVLLAMLDVPRIADTSEWLTGRARAAIKEAVENEAEQLRMEGRSFDSKEELKNHLDAIYGYEARDTGEYLDDGYVADVWDAMKLLDKPHTVRKGATE